MSTFDFTEISTLLVNSFPASKQILGLIYLGATIVMVQMYFVQAYKYVAGKDGAGDFHFSSKNWQLAMRSVGLIYTLYIADGSLFAVIALDMVGRASEMVAAWYANDRIKKQMCTKNDNALAHF